MSLFDFAAFNQPAQAEGTAQPSIFPHPALPSRSLTRRCALSHDQNSRLIICAYFKRIRPLEDNTRFLMEHYGENGAGFYLDSRKYSIWYNAEGSMWQRVKLHSAQRPL